MHIERWAIDPELAREAEENYRTAYAKRLADYSGIEIMRQLTFDGVVPRITPEEVEALLSWISTHILPRPLRGVGVEVGSGPLVFSSILARSPEISRMYGWRSVRHSSKSLRRLLRAICWVPIAKNSLVLWEVLTLWR
jgi:hypothetical protein